METNDKELQPKKRWKKVVLIIICIILLLLLLIGTVGALFINGLLNRINKTDGTMSTMSSSEMDAFLQDNTDPSDPDFTGEVLDPTDVTWEDTPQIEAGPNMINILLIGSDTRTPGIRARSDTMILCTLNKSAKTLTMTSFMRDMYVQIPGHAANRLNVAYAFGGMSLLNQAMEQNFGVTVDGNFAVEFNGFKDVIDAIGGVTINLSKTEANYMSRPALWPAEDRKYTDMQFEEGPNHLNGTEALTYSRIRSIGPADFGRTLRQRNVMTAAFNKCKNLSVSEIYSLLDTILPMMTTNLSNSEILSYAAQTIPLLSDLTIVTERIPADKAYKNAWVSGMAVLIPDLDASRELLSKILTDEIAP